MHENGLALAHGLNKRCRVPGRNHASNSKACLITRVYGILF